MLPPDTIITSAIRWLQLLRASTISQAWLLIGSDPRYTDIGKTQHAIALEWLIALGLVVESSGQLGIVERVRRGPLSTTARFVFESALEFEQPAWLSDSDVLVDDTNDIPQDALALAAALQLDDASALAGIRVVHGKIDLAKREQIGAAGEMELLKYLEERWPGSTVHISLAHDGFGYDILLFHSGREWHIEVKATTRRGRVVIFLSRNEHEVALLDPKWQLVVVFLDESLGLRELATVRYSNLIARMPFDQAVEARWESVSHKLGPQDFESGLSFLAP